MLPAWLALLVAIGLLALADSRSRLLLGNTAILALGTCALSVPVGTLLALMVVKTDLPGRRWVALGLGVLLFVPLYLQCAAWQAGFGLQGWWTIVCHGQAWLDGWRGAIWVQGLAAVPWAALVVAAGLRVVEPEFEEQALLDGTPRQVFFRVTLRRAVPAVVLAALWIAVTTAGQMTVTDLMQIRTYAEEVYCDFATAGVWGAKPAPFWLGVGLTGLSVMAAGIACVGLAPNARQPVVCRPWRLKLGRYRWPALAMVVLMLLVLLAVPLGNLTYQAGLSATRVGDQRVRTWSCEKLATVVVDGLVRNQRELCWSLVIATCAAGAVGLVALFLAWLARDGGWRVAPLLIAVATALALPGPVLGVLIIHLFNHREPVLLAWLYDRSILAPWLAQTIRALPLPALVLWHALSTVPSATLDSAATEGAGWLTRLTWIALPTRVPALVAAGFLAAVVALGELSATILVVPPDMPTLPVRIFGLLHFGAEGRVAGICLAIILIVIVLTVVIWIATEAGRWVRDR